MTDLEFEQYLTSFIKMYTTNLKKLWQTVPRISSHLNLNVKWIY